MFCIYSLIRSPILIGLEIGLNKIDTYVLKKNKERGFNVKQITSRTLNVMYILYFYQCRISVIVIKSAKKTPQLIIMTFMTRCLLMMLLVLVSHILCFGLLYI